jgi:nucleobase:cation symporter-1, NCS1 family
MKQGLTDRKHHVIITRKAGHIQQEAAMATQSREPTAEEEQERGLLGQIEVHSIDWIPDTERHGKTWQQAMLWFLGNFQYFTIPIGFVGPALGLSLGWSILAGAAGIAFGTLFMAFHATQGPVFGLPQMIQTRAQLGYRGVVVALFAVLFTYMAFNVADQVLLASGLHGAFGWNAHLVAAVTAVLAAALAIFGYDWVHRVFRFLLILSFPCYAIISVAILIGHAGGTAPHHPGGFLFAAFMSQFSVAAAYNITYAPYVSDYSRYMPRNTSPRGIIAAVFFGASGSAVWLIALGAWLATRLGVSDGLVGLQRVGDNVAAPLGSITAFLSATALLATMGMNGYGGMLTVLTGVDSFKTLKTSRAWRVATVLVLAVIWYAIGESISTSGSSTAVSAVLNSLTLMLYLLVPWTALNLVDFFFVRRGHYAITDIFRPDGVYGAWGWRGLTAYFVGFAAEIPFMVLPPIFGLSYTGPIPNHVTNGVDYSWLVGLVVSGVVYLILSRSLDLTAEQAAIAASERELQAIDVIAEAAALAEHGHPDAQEAATTAELGPTDAQAPKDGE